MYISQTLDPFYKYDEPIKLVERFKNAGFDAYDFSFIATDFVDREDYLEFAKELRKHADEIGIVCNQAHAPFPTQRPGDEEYNKLVFKRIIRSMEAASILGAKIIVIHPWNLFRYKENIELYNKYLPYAKKLNIKIGVENMWWHRQPGNLRVTPAACSLVDDYVKTMEGLDPNYFVACLDIGHGEMFGKGYSSELIKALGKSLGALHIHDNDTFNDNHWIPGQGDIDFIQMAKDLKSINYQGDITLEVMNDKQGSELLAALPYLAEFADKIRKLVQ